VLTRTGAFVSIRTLVEVTDAVCPALSTAVTVNIYVPSLACVAASTGTAKLYDFAVVDDNAAISVAVNDLKFAA